MTRLRQFGALAAVLALAYASTVFLPYALNDENWIIRASAWWNRFDVRQGRPIFGYVIYLTSRMRDTIGLDVIPLLRVGAIVGLAAGLTMLALWLQRWGWSVRQSLLACIVAASLPPFQIYIADATWIVMPFAASVAATWLVSRAYHGTAALPRRLATYLAAVALILFALGFYQPSIHVGLGMLIVPLMAAPIGDRKAVGAFVRFAAFTCAIYAAVIVVYYAAWSVAWHAVGDTSAGSYYSPAALNTDPIGRIRYFFTDRMLQILNLWYVDSLRLTAYSVAALSIIVVGAAAEWWRASQRDSAAALIGPWAVKYVSAVAVLILADCVGLAAGSPVPSYVTAPALSFAVVIWIIHAARELSSGLGDGPRALDASLAVVAVFGLLIAQYTVLTYFSLPMFLEYRLVKSEVRDYMRTHHAVERVHVVGRKQGLLNRGLHEFSWSNVTFDVYTRDMVKNVLDDLGLSSDIEVTASDALAMTLPVVAKPVEGSAVIVDFSRLGLK